MGLDTVFGVPSHPLVVHAVVVLVPLAALGVLVTAFHAGLRARFGVLVPALAVLTVALVPVATSSGEELEKRIAPVRGVGKLVDRHTEMGEQLLPFVIVMAVGAVALFLIRRAQEQRPEAPPAWAAPWALLLATVLAVGGSVASVVQVGRIGHSGAKAAWQDVADR